MTLCLAVKYPLSYLRNFPAPLEEAIIFLSDSRITYTDGTKDIVDKIIPICKNAAVVIAGNARFQLESILSIKQRLDESENYPVDKIIDIIEDCYQSKRSLYVNPPLIQTIVGIFDRSNNKSRLFKISIETGMRAKELITNGEMYFIGSEEFRQEFTKLEIEQAIKKQDGNYLAFYPLEWANLFYRVFNEEFNVKKQDKTIGGIIQSACLYKDGFMWANHMGLSFDNNGEMVVLEKTVRKNDGWSRILQNNKEEKTYPLVEVLKELK
ncbi:hypothetical protein PTHTG4_27190 [Parageobacillus thermoglucosidasius]|uniref:hypothetical protein n=1 Tax=Parageobacillus thermoglucosidasius TaxID=1426 RepID=UPI000F6279F4|nr:hypothetical protein [Parageobacillus thermoglucosidasius]GCD83655.1 hypothetical protein PTHTG4_27190 [Parageobacillus thermoglucosidasius]